MTGLNVLNFIHPQGERGNHSGHGGRTPFCFGGSTPAIPMQRFKCCRSLRRLLKWNKSSKKRQGTEPTTTQVAGWLFTSVCWQCSKSNCRSAHLLVLLRNLHVQAKAKRQKPPKRLCSQYQPQGLVKRMSRRYKSRPHGSVFLRAAASAPLGRSQLCCRPQLQNPRVDNQRRRGGYGHEARKYRQDRRGCSPNRSGIRLRRRKPRTFEKVQQLTKREAESVAWGAAWHGALGRLGCHAILRRCCETKLPCPEVARHKTNSFSDIYITADHTRARNKAMLSVPGPRRSTQRRVTRLVHSLAKPATALTT